jgi:hypothetical protein
MHAARQRRAWKGKEKQPKRAQNVMTPYDLGWHHAALRWAAMATRVPHPPIVCPYRDASAVADYDRGGRAAMAKFAREDRKDAGHAHHTPQRRPQADPARGLPLDGGKLGRTD